MQILHYVNGQKYEPHYDYFHDAVNTSPDKGGQRVVTMLMYLTTPEEGGETVFPKASMKVRPQGKPGQTWRVLWLMPRNSSIGRFLERLCLAMGRTRAFLSSHGGRAVVIEPSVQGHGIEPGLPKARYADQ